jgi:hypothetical protein
MGKGMNDEGPDSRGQEAGQEGGSQEDGCTHRFWDALNELHRVIILKAMGQPPWLFYFLGGHGWGRIEGTMLEKRGERKFCLYWAV